MLLEKGICDRARMARDPRFDGLFFIGVLSTGIYCRPICPAPAPKPENIVYYPTAAAAADAGLRPCLRCRPEASPGSPAWNGTSATVSRAMLLIRQGALNEGSVADLAARLGVGDRHLLRLFKEHVGVSPLTLATTQNILFAKKLLTETAMPISEIAFASGFGSIRRFNAAFRSIYGKAPSDLRKPMKSTGRQGMTMFQCELSLSYRPPFDWPAMSAFFGDRAIPGVECVADGVYHRTARINGASGKISVAHAKKGHALTLAVELPDSRDLMPVVERVRRMFDLDANMPEIHKALSVDPLLAKIVKKRSGLRLPVSWDPFESAVRAVVGQQISVKGSRTIIGRIAAKAGPEVDVPDRPELSRLFPTPEELFTCDLGIIGMPAKRVATIKALSKAVAGGEVSLLVNGSMDHFVETLVRISGIGDWTAQYIAMRALGEPDAFPAADLGIIKALQEGDERPTPRQVRRRAEAWRPWRAYAAIYLWRA